jgi:hypothetical protein
VVGLRRGELMVAAGDKGRGVEVVEGLGEVGLRDGLQGGVVVARAASRLGSREVIGCGIASCVAR